MWVACPPLCPRLALRAPLRHTQARVHRAPHLSDRACGVPDAVCGLCLWTAHTHARSYTGTLVRDRGRVPVLFAASYPLITIAHGHVSA